MFKRFFNATAVHWKLKEARTADTFTFSTRYPKGLAMPLKVKMRNRNSKEKRSRIDILSKITRKLNPRGMEPKTKREKVPREKIFSQKLTAKDKVHVEKFRLVTEQDKEWGQVEDGEKPRFETMKLQEDVVVAIRKGLLFNRASQVQEALISTSLTQPNSHILCGSQTGSGKTVAYLAPIFHFLKTQEVNAMERTDGFEMMEASTLSGISLVNQGLSTIRKLKRPRVIILVPTRTLIQQITKVSKQMGYYCKQRIVGIHSKTKNVPELLSSPVDILITTPSCVLELIKDHQLSLSNVLRAVFDEADSLFDKNFSPETTKVLDHLESISNRRNRSIPVTMVTATFPQSLNRSTARFPDLVRLTTASLHKTPNKLHQDFLLLGQSTTKDNLLIETLKRAVNDTNRILVFCNTQQSTDQVYNFLTTKKYPILKCSSKMQREDMEQSLKEFTTKSEDLLVMVATDVASRGIDTTLVGQVILYDFPHTAIDYMHRVGRTARFGRPGRATSFVTKRDQMLANTIQDSIKSRRALS